MIMDCWSGAGAIGCTGGVSEVLVDITGIWRDEQAWCEIGRTKPSFDGQNSSVGVPRCDITDIGGLMLSHVKCDMLLAGGHPLCIGGKLGTKFSTLLATLSRTSCRKSAQLPIEAQNKVNSLCAIYQVYYSTW